MQLDQFYRQNFLQDDIKERAQNRAVDGADAADKSNQHGIERPNRREGMLRVVAYMIVREVAAAETGRGRGERQRQELMAKRADS